MAKKRKNDYDSPYKISRMLLIALIIILVWHGVSGLVDTYLFPDHETLSNILAIVIAIFLFVVGRVKLKELD